MLVLSRKPGEKIMIGNSVTLTMLGVFGNKLRIGVEAPGHVRILRAELGEWQIGSISNDGHLDPTLKAFPDWSEASAKGIGQAASNRATMPYNPRGHE